MGGFVRKLFEHKNLFKCDVEKSLLQMLFVLNNSIICTHQVFSHYSENQN